MDVYFHSEELAALCDSERRLADRWGSVAGHTVGRRLLEVGATDSAHLNRLPRANVSRSRRGETTIDFGDVVIKGMISGDGRDDERFVITSIEVEGGAPR